MLDGTPVYDIKPYVPHCDIKQNAIGGFSDEVKDYSLKVEFDEDLFTLIDDDIKKQIINIISHDPRPSYQNDNQRVYGFRFDGFEIKFSVLDDLIAKIISITKTP